MSLKNSPSRAEVKSSAGLTVEISSTELMSSAVAVNFNEIHEVKWILIS